MKIRFRLEKYPGFAPNTRADEFAAHLYLNDATRSFGEAKLWRNMYESEVRTSVGTLRSWLLDLTNQGPLFKAGVPSEDEMLAALREAAEAFDPQFAATIAWPKLQPVQAASTTTNPVEVNNGGYITFGRLKQGFTFTTAENGPLDYVRYLLMKVAPSGSHNTVRLSDGALLHCEDTMPIIRIL